MGKLNLGQRMIDPKSPDRRPRRAAYALPTFFTAGNIFLGYVSVIQSFQGAMMASGAGAAACDAGAAACAIAGKRPAPARPAESRRTESGTEESLPRPLVSGYECRVRTNSIDR